MRKKVTFVVERLAKNRKSVAFHEKYFNISVQDKNSNKPTSREMDSLDMDWAASEASLCSPVISDHKMNSKFILNIH